MPKRGLGDTSVERGSFAGGRAMCLFRAAREIVETEELGGKARKALTDLVDCSSAGVVSLAAMKPPSLPS